MMRPRQPREKRDVARASALISGSSLDREKHE
jgi:hypothetical protein